MSEEQAQYQVGEQKDETVKQFSFDLSRLSLDEVLDVIELAGLDKSEFDRKAFVKVVRSLRKALTPGSSALTGADVQPVINAFIAYVLGGGEAQRKN